MKKTVIIGSFLALLVIGVLGAGANVAAQDITGGYGNVSVKDKEVRHVARFAIKNRTRVSGVKFTLVRIVKAEVQVVAGLNYRICMVIREGRKRARTITTVICRDLKKRHSLTRWKAGGCLEL